MVVVTCTQLDILLLMWAGLKQTMSAVLKDYKKEITHVLALSAPSRRMLTIGLYSKGVLSQLEELEITEDTSSVSSASRLINYIIDRIDNYMYNEVVWRELNDIEALRATVTKMRNG